MTDRIDTALAKAEALDARVHPQSWKAMRNKQGQMLIVYYADDGDWVGLAQTFINSERRGADTERAEYIVRCANGYLAAIRALARAHSFLASLPYSTEDGWAGQIADIASVLDAFVDAQEGML